MDCQEDVDTYVRKANMISLTDLFPSLQNWNMLDSARLSEPLKCPFGGLLARCFWSFASKSDSLIPYQRCALVPSASDYRVGVLSLLCPTFSRTVHLHNFWTSTPLHLSPAPVGPHVTTSLCHSALLLLPPRSPLQGRALWVLRGLWVQLGTRQPFLSGSCTLLRTRSGQSTLGTAGLPLTVEGKRTAVPHLPHPLFRLDQTHKRCTQTLRGWGVTP